VTTVNLGIDILFIMNDYVDRTIAAYNSSPIKFEERTKNLLPGEELEWFIESLPAGGYIMDAGCAYGRETASLAGKGFKVVGIDLSTILLRRARELYPDLSFKKADVRSLPFPNGSFDGIWANAILLHLNDDDINKTLREFYRVLKPNGRIFISFKKGTEVGNKLEPFSADDDRFYNDKVIETLKPTLKKCGFKIARWRYMNEKERGVQARDLEWLNVHAIKASK
jgi:SAM-dependent methyltransferase